MNIKEFRDWINVLPEEFNDFEIVFQEVLRPSDDSDVLYVKHTPIVMARINEQTRELLMEDGTN